MIRRRDRVIRWTTTLSVVVLAGIAAIISYRHMFLLVHRYGETSWTAVLLPVSVDGMIAASSMSLLASSRQRERSGVLPWVLLIAGSAASLAANVAVAKPSAVGRLIAAWPSAALIGSYELLMRQIRRTVVGCWPEEGVASYGTHTVVTANDAVSCERSDNGHTDTPLKVSYAAQMQRAEQSRGNPPEKISAHGSEWSELAGVRHRRTMSGLQRQAWQWALANRTPEEICPLVR
jgi:hypothetical protein